jgi:hypothetical protein
MAEPFKRIDSDALQREIFDNIETFLQHLYPNGSINRHKQQFFIGDLDGNGGKSTKINLTGEHKGVAYDWQTQGATADWIAIWMRNKSVTFRVACEQICDILGVSLDTVSEHHDDGIIRAPKAKAKEAPHVKQIHSDHIDWPAQDCSYVDEEVRKSITLRDLVDKSPTKFRDDESHAEEVIDILFPGDPFLCVGKAANIFCTRHRTKLRGKMEKCQFIVPNPMKHWRGINADGNRSERCADNVGPREFLVIECDFAKYKLNKTTGVQEPTKWLPFIEKWEAKGLSVADACAALLWKMSKLLPLMMVVSSGGKSLHGWFHTRGLPETELLGCMKFCVLNGADPATWRPFQLVRMPGGMRDNGKRQSILYFNQKARIEGMER